ncbi:MAG: hypothetical protein AB7I01_14155 [Gammaproteobacteria bacterium]
MRTFDAAQPEVHDWYNNMHPDASYLDALTRLGGAMSTASKSLAGLFERLASHQLQATQEMTHVAQDPSRYPQAYAAWQARMVQLRAEMQGAMEKLQRDADLLYEELRRGVDSTARAPFETPMGMPADGSQVAPAMKFGSAASEGLDGPGGWRFDPGAVLGAPTASSPATAAAPMNNGAPLPPWQWPSWNWLWTLPPPPMPAMASNPWHAPMPSGEALPPTVERYDYVAPPAGAALQTPPAVDADVAASQTDARAAELMFPPAPPPPPAPASVYPAPSPTSDAVSGISYRSAGYRRVARAKP